MPTRTRTIVDALGDIRKEQTRHDGGLLLRFFMKQYELEKYDGNQTVPI